MEKDIRMSYCVFPNFTQNFWTWLTGKALPGQRPLFIHRWWSYLGVTLGAYMSGFLFVILAVTFQFQFWPIAILPGWVLMLHGARTLYLVILHQSVHSRFSGRRKWDEFLGGLAALLIFSPNFKEFGHEHFKIHHHSKTFATQRDAQAKLMLQLGIRPGLSVRSLRFRSILSLISPAYHISTFFKRLKSSLAYQGAGWLPVQALFFSVLFALHVFLPNGIIAMILSFWVPIIFFYQMSALLQNLSEHGWLKSKDEALLARHYHTDRSWGRFTGSPPPEGNGFFILEAARWVGWFLLTLFCHVPIRLLVLVGDIPNHDYHHRYPSSKHWMIAAYARQTDIDNGHSQWPPYKEFWGVWHAINCVLEGISNAKLPSNVSSASESITQKHEYNRLS